MGVTSGLWRRPRGDRGKVDPRGGHFLPTNGMPELIQENRSANIVRFQQCCPWESTHSLDLKDSSEP